jgi:hypothetical protein
MQQTLPLPAANKWFQAAFARLTGSDKRRAPVVAIHGDVKMTDQLEREWAEREFRRWR